MLVLLLLLQVSSASCADVAECRRLALDAASRGDAEAFHDLAWRTVQKGKRNDPELMLLLARAQSLSGRPGDALVMLMRLADLGVTPDVVTDPDFARVRALAGWPELEARLTAKSVAAPSAPPAPATSAPAPSATAPPAPAAPAAPAAAAPSAPPAPPASASSSSAAPSLPFSAPGLEPFALAHDAVSRRFVLGDRRAHRLVVVDEVSRNVVNYVGAASAGFLDRLTAFTIDARRGDLWVASAQGEGDDVESAVHKLQLVSGRSLLDARAAKTAGPTQLVGVAVAPDGTVYALDARGPRLLRLRPGTKTLDVVMRVDATDPAAIAASDEGSVFVADASGVIRIDPAEKTAARVKSAENLGGFESIAWRGGALIGIERVAGSYLVARIKLDASGSRAQPRQILAASPTSTVGTLAGDAYYYVAEDQIIRRVSVR